MRIAERRLTHRRAAGLLQIGERQVRRLYRLRGSEPRGFRDSRSARR